MKNKIMKTMLTGVVVVTIAASGLVTAVQPAQATELDQLAEVAEPQANATVEQVTEPESPVEAPYTDVHISEPIYLTAAASPNTVTPEVATADEAVASSPVDEDIKLHKSQIYMSANAHRNDASVTRLKGNKTLDKMAQDWANFMAQTGNYYHNPDLASLFNTGQGWTSAGENIGYGYANGVLAAEAWWNSPGHRKNILRPTYNHIGIGVAYSGGNVPYYVQVFGSSNRANDYLEYDIDADGTDDGSSSNGGNNDSNGNGSGSNSNSNSNSNSGGTTPKPPTESPFLDVKSTDKFFKEIKWMFENKLTGGVKTPEGLKYHPKSSMSREAMAAFMYRMSDTKGYKPNGKKPFADVPTSHKFYKEISWMKDTGMTTGVKQQNGQVLYKTQDKVTREAMSAFLYRLAGQPAFSTPGKSPFADMTPGQKFYKESAWMASTGVTTGVKLGNGRTGYKPKASVTREAMAAFIYRYKN